VLQFRNETPFEGALNLFPDADGIDTLFNVVKGTFSFGPRLTLADEQVPLTVEPEYHADPTSSSIKRPSDVSLVKPGTDIVLLGCARTLGERPQAQMDVSVAVGAIGRVVRVFGDRVWRSNGASYDMTAPEPFQVIPLVWERAFGGQDTTPKGPQLDARNPVGTGFRATDGDTAVDGVALPNVEDPADPISSWKHRPAPAGFAPIAAHWEPRRSYAGTYNEAWTSNRSPYLPDDFDARFLQIAPIGLSAAGELRGDEPVELHGVSPTGPIRLRLPGARLRIVYRVDGSAQDRPAMLDTVIIEPDEQRLSLVWRASLRCDKIALKISEVSAALLTAV
jgi:hypothetical protein